MIQYQPWKILTGSKNYFKIANRFLLIARQIIKPKFKSMKKLNIPEYYPGYYTTTDHPGIIDVENANFISILAKGSFKEEIFYQPIALLEQAAQAVIALFQESSKGYGLSAFDL